MSNDKKRKGFTFVELIGVIGVLLLLMLILLPRTGLLKDSTKEMAVTKNTDLISTYTENIQETKIKSTATVSEKAEEIRKALNSNEELSKLTNPYDTSSKGVSAVQVYDGTQANTPLPVGNNAIIIYSCDQDVPVLP